MKVAFWSNIRGQSGATTNLALMSVLRALLERKQTILLENHFNINNLETILMQRQNAWMVRENDSYYYHMGLEYLMKSIYNTQEKSLLIRRSAIPLLDSNILYLPQSNIINREVFSYEFSQVMYQLFQSLESVAETVFIDTEVNDNLSSRLILDEADRVVVNLSQNPYVLDDFFGHYDSLKDKAVYLMGNYRPHSKYNLRQIIEEYQIPEEKIAVIPYHTELADALAEGRLIGFLSRNIQCHEKEENYLFAEQLKKASHMLETNMKQ